jgi:Transposase/Phage integrase family/zinc-finger of transposase IS204/IS1001/IS1096/IS1165
VHSTYRRTVADLPLAGATLVLHLQVRRFFCRHTTCPQRIVAERFPTLVPVRGRHSWGVCAALRHVGLAVGGRMGVRLTRALGIPGSDQTIVRLVHGALFPLLEVPRVIGLDEWAWRRGRRFGTILCDLERHHVLDLLPERSASSVAQWLQTHPSVEIVCRDRSGLYAEGIRQGAPQAIQVVDRFHLVQNLRDALARFFPLNRSRQLTATGMNRFDVFQMIKRRAREVGLPPTICCHTFRATGITAYLENGGTLEKAQAIAAHESPRTTKLYDRTTDDITLQEVERIASAI